MQEDNQFEYRQAIKLPAPDSFALFPLSNAYFVGYILKVLSMSTYPCTPDHHSDQTSNLVCNQCSEFRGKYEKYLIRRLYEAVVNGEFELWNSDLKFVEAPPVNPNPAGNDLWWWMMVSHIYKSDLSKFCKSERIYVKFDGENEQNSEYSGNHVVSAKKENNANLNECISPSAANQQAQDAGNGIQDAWAGHVDQTTLNKNVENLKVEAPESSVKEAKEDRVARLKKRKSALKAQGVRCYLKTLAEEEGISVPRIKQLVSEKKQQSKGSISWVSQLDTCNSPKKKCNS